MINKHSEWSNGSNGKRKRERGSVGRQGIKEGRGTRETEKGVRVGDGINNKYKWSKTFSDTPDDTEPTEKALL